MTLCQSTHTSQGHKTQSSLSLFQSPSEGTPLPQATPQTIGSFPRNFHKHLPPGSFCDASCGCLPALQNAPPAIPQVPRIPPHILHPASHLHSWTCLTLPHSSSGFSIRLPTHFPSQGGSPHSSTPPKSFGSQALPTQVLGARPGPVRASDPGTPSPALRSHTCQGSPKFPPQRGGHTSSSGTPRHLALIPRVLNTAVFQSLLSKRSETHPSRAP